MGLSFGVSNCSCDSLMVKKDINPDPDNFKIKKAKLIRDFIILFVNYPDCTNYEGNKILVFEDIEYHELLTKNRLDPHFCDNDNCISPIARFEPTDKGWNMAVDFCSLMSIIMSKKSDAKKYAKVNIT